MSEKESKKLTEGIEETTPTKEDRSGHIAMPEENYYIARAIAGIFEAIDVNYVNSDDLHTLAGHMGDLLKEDVHMYNPKNDPNND